MMTGIRFNVIPFNLLFRNSEDEQQVNSPISYGIIQNATHGNKPPLSSDNMVMVMPSKCCKFKTLGLVIFALLCILLLSQTSEAKTVTDLPNGLCSSSHYQCDAKTLARWLQFENSNGLEIGSTNFLSVGSCSRNGNSNSKVNVVLALSKNVNELYFDATIRFYDNLENHKNTPASQIEKIFPNIHLERNILTVLDSHAYIDYSEFTPYRYWLRYNKPSNQILLVAYFGFKDTFLCVFESINA